MMFSNMLSDNSSSHQLDLFGSGTTLPEGHQTGIKSLLSLSRSNALFSAPLAGFNLFHQKF